MRKMYKIATVIAVTLSLALSIAACGSEAKTAVEKSTADKTGIVQKTTAAEDTQKKTDAKEPVKISMMTSQAKFKDSYNKIITQLKEKENITVDVQVLPDEQYFEALRVKLATEEAPDLFEHNTPTSYAVVNAEKNCAELSGEPWFARLVNPGLVKDAQGKVYGMPRESSSFYSACYYNKKVFLELGLSEPNTYAEFIAVLDKIKKSGKGITPIYMSDKDSWTTQIFMTIGVPVVLGDRAKETWENVVANKLKFSNIPEYAEVLNMFKDLYKNGYTNKDNMSATYDMAKEAVATGKAAMMYNGEWCATDMLSKYKDVELGAFIIPFKDKQIMGTGAYVQGMFIPNKSKNVENAKRVLNLWSQPEYLNIHFAENPGFPAFKDVDGGKTPECVKALVDKYISTGKYIYQMNDPLAVMSPIQPEWWKYYQEFIVGGKDAKGVLAAMDKKTESYMKSKKEPGW